MTGQNTSDLINTSAFFLSNLPVMGGGPAAGLATGVAANVLSKVAENPIQYSTPVEQNNQAAQSAKELNEIEQSQTSENVEAPERPQVEDACFQEVRALAERKKRQIKIQKLFLGNSDQKEEAKDRWRAVLADCKPPEYSVLNPKRGETFVVMDPEELRGIIEDPSQEGSVLQIQAGLIVLGRGDGLGTYGMDGKMGAFTQFAIEDFVEKYNNGYFHLREGKERGWKPDPPITLEQAPSKINELALKELNGDSGDAKEDAVCDRGKSDSVDAKAEESPEGAEDGSATPEVEEATNDDQVDSGNDKVNIDEKKFEEKTGIKVTEENREQVNNYLAAVEEAKEVAEETILNQEGGLGEGVRQWNEAKDKVAIAALGIDIGFSIIVGYNLEKFDNSLEQGSPDSLSLPGEEAIQAAEEKSVA